MLQRQSFAGNFRSTLNYAIEKCGETKRLRKSATNGEKIARKADDNVPHCMGAAKVFWKQPRAVAQLTHRFVVYVLSRNRRCMSRWFFNFICS